MDTEKRMSGPREPSAEMRVFASQVHQMFTALVAEGFAEHQALVIVGQMINRQNPGP
jgi:hypothetical protein